MGGLKRCMSNTSLFYGQATAWTHAMKLILVSRITNFVRLFYSSLFFYLGQLFITENIQNVYLFFEFYIGTHLLGNVGYLEY